MTNPECPTCPIENNPALVQLAGRVGRVYVSEAMLASDYAFDAEDEIRQREITTADIDELRPKINEDASLSLTSCFTVLHEAAQQDQETLSSLVDEQKVALAGCATCRLQRTCYLEGFVPKEAAKEQAPQSRLRYPEGWQEVLEAPDAVDYQFWLGELMGITLRRCHELGNVPDWAQDAGDALRTRWQRAIEQVADIAIDPEDLATMTQAEIVETALVTFKTNLDSLGWDEEGLAFTIPNMFTGEEARIDLRELPEGDSD